MDHREHIERHFTGGATVRDVVIGMSDGLTVPFALAAGLAGAVASSRVVITAGLAEIAAGSIAMGLGGYLAAQGDAEHFRSELAREEDEIVRYPDVEIREVADVFVSFGLEEEEAMTVANSLSKRPKAWVDFMMRFELGLETPDPKRAWQSGLTIAGAYIVGGAIPLSPYLVIASPRAALIPSAIVTLIALSIFGYVKGRMTGVSAIKTALQTVLVGGVAATAAFGLARMFS